MLLLAIASITGERFRHGTDADDAGRSHGLDSFEEGRDRSAVLRKFLESAKSVREVTIRP
jgi:hypothetical protein